MIFCAGLFLLGFYFLFPLIESIVFGLVFSYVGRPIRDLFDKDKRLGSFIATICIIIPLAIVFFLGGTEILRQIKWLEEHQNEIILSGYGLISNNSSHEIFFNELSRSMQNILETTLHLLTTLPIFSLGTTILLGVLNFLISLCVCYFILLDGNNFANSVLTLLNQPNYEFENRCFNHIDNILCGIYEGSVYTAIAGSINSIVIFTFLVSPDQSPWPVSSFWQEWFHS